MQTDIIEYLKSEIKTRCESENNFFGLGCYHHIQAVVKNAELLAPAYGADPEVVVIASWLHDIASITDYKLYENHHIHGAEIAGALLSTFHYDPEKTDLVKKCILNHRGSKPMQKQSPEEICVADADAISHFDALPSLFYLAYATRGLPLDEGADFVINKLKRSYLKLSGKGKALCQPKYEQVLSILSP